MLPDQLKAYPRAAALAFFDPASIVTGDFQHGELTLEIAPGKIVDFCRHLKSDLQFERVSSITAVDRHPAELRFEVVYHLHSIARNERLRLKCRLSGSVPEIESVTPVWQAANWFEREVFDLFGIRFGNHPDLRRILLPDDWVGHPLRKDYPVAGYK